MSELHTFWTEKKSLAEKLYKLGLQTKLKEMKEELDKRHKGYDDPEGYKRELGEIKAEVTGLATYPLKFDLDLGKALDKVEKLYKLSNPSPTEDKARKVVASEAQVTVGHYIRHVKQKSSQLQEVDGQISIILEEALTKMSKILETYKRDSKEGMKYAFDHVADLKENWKEAKKSSENALKKLVENPKAALLMKSEKLGTSFPLKFNKNLSSLIESLVKDMVAIKQTVPNSAAKVVLVAKGYLEETKIIRKKYEAVLSNGFAPQLKLIFDPLNDELLEVVSKVEKAATPIKLM